MEALSQRLCSGSGGWGGSPSRMMLMIPVICMLLLVWRYMQVTDFRLGLTVTK